MTLTLKCMFYDEINLISMQEAGGQWLHYPPPWSLDNQSAQSQDRWTGQRTTGGGERRWYKDPDSHKSYKVIVHKMQRKSEAKDKCLT